MNKNIFLFTGLSVLGLGFSTLLAQTTTGSLPSSVHASGAGQVITPVAVVTPAPASTPRPHHRHHAAQQTSAASNTGFMSGTVVGMAPPTVTPAAQSGNTLNLPMGVATSVPLKP